MNTHWYLIAHRAGARIFEQEGVKPELRLIRNFENPEGKLKTSELVFDRQGRSESSNTLRHNALGDSDEPRQRVLESFVRELGEFLEKEALRNAFTSIVLVAEPHFLGELKKVIGKVTSQRLSETVTKDLVHVSDQDIERYLKGVLHTRDEIHS